MKQNEGNCITHAWRYTYVGHQIDALPGWSVLPPGLCVVTYLLGRRGLSYVLRLAKHGAELPPPGYRVCVSMLLSYGYVLAL